MFGSAFSGAFVSHSQKQINDKIFKKYKISIKNLLKKARFKICVYFKIRFLNTLFWRRIFNCGVFFKFNYFFFYFERQQNLQIVQEIQYQFFQGDHSKLFCPLL